MQDNVRKYKGKSIDKLQDDYVLVDIETTGFSPVNDDIIEIGAIKVKDNKVIDEFHSLIKIDRKINPYITNLIGITNDMLEDGKDIDIALNEFLEFAGDNILMAHNTNFDINFLYEKSNKYLNKYLTNDFIDTMRVSKNMLPELPNYKLGTLASYFNIYVNEISTFSTVKVKKYKMRLSRKIHKYIFPTYFLYFHLLDHLVNYHVYRILNHDKDNPMFCLVY